MVSNRAWMAVFPINEQQLLPFMFQIASPRGAVDRLATNSRNRASRPGIGNPLLLPVCGQSLLQTFTLRKIALMSSWLRNRGRIARRHRTRKQQSRQAQRTKQKTNSLKSLVPPIVYFTGCLLCKGSSHHFTHQNQLNQLICETRSSCFHIQVLLKLK